MGMFIRAQEKNYDKDYYSTGNNTVCTNCFQEYGLQQFIKENGQYTNCSYCGSNDDKVIACELDLLIEHILRCIFSEWEPAQDNLPWESREGGYQFGDIKETFDLLINLDVGDCDKDVFNDICSSIHITQWCKKDPYSLSLNETLLYGWQEFSDFVKTKVRYFFLDAENSAYDENQNDQINPVKIIDFLMDAIKTLKLVKVIEKEKEIYRVRIVNPDVDYTRAKDLGSPPAEYATIPNRMSAAGISMFYGAFDAETALAETYVQCANEKKGIYGIFKPSRNLTVVDLSLLPRIPSLFDDNFKDNRALVRFIIDFVADFTKPIDRENRSHVDYVPTQIITEYLRTIFKTERGIKIDGVIYPSSKECNGKAIVIFASNEQCIDSEDAIEDELELTLRLMKTETNNLMPS